MSEHWSRELSSIGRNNLPWEVIAWAEQAGSAREAWSRCPRADYLLWGLGRAGVDLGILSQLVCGILTEIDELLPADASMTRAALRRLPEAVTKVGAFEFIDRRAFRKAQNATKLAALSAAKAAKREPRGWAAAQAFSAATSALSMIYVPRSGPLIASGLDLYPWMTARSSAEAWTWAKTIARSESERQVWVAEALWRAAGPIHSAWWPAPVAPVAGCRPELAVAWDLVVEHKTEDWSTADWLSAFFEIPSGSDALIRAIPGPSEAEKRLLNAIYLRMAASEDPRLRLHVIQLLATTW